MKSSSVHVNAAIEENPNKLSLMFFFLFFFVFIQNFFFLFCAKIKNLKFLASFFFIYFFGKNCLKSSGFTPAITPCSIPPMLCTTCCISC